MSSGGIVPVACSTIECPTTGVDGAVSPSVKPEASAGADDAARASAPAAAPIIAFADLFTADLLSWLSARAARSAAGRAGLSARQPHSGAAGRAGLSARQ